MSLGQGSFSADGYVREACLEALATFPATEAAPFFLLRLHDWVDPIAERAVAWLRAHPQTAAAWPRLLSAQLGKGRRPVGDWWPPVAGAILEQPQPSSVLVPHLLPFGPSAEQVKAWLASQDLRTRLACARHVLSVPELSPLRALLHYDSSPLIRRLDLPWSAGLWDSSRTVRSQAIWQCRAQGEDPALRYRDALPDIRALRGLAQCAAASDAGTFQKFLAHPLAGVRAWCLDALARLDSAAGESAARSLLDSDPSVKVRRQALAILGRALPLPRLLQLCQSDAPGLRRRARTLLARAHPWQDLLLILQEADVTRLKVWLHRYSGRSWLRPEASLREPLRRAWLEAGWLSPGQKQALAFLE